MIGVVVQGGLHGWGFFGKIVRIGVRSWAKLEAGVNSKRTRVLY